MRIVISAIHIFFASLHLAEGGSRAISRFSTIQILLYGSYKIYFFALLEITPGFGSTQNITIELKLQYNLNSYNQIILQPQDYQS